MHVIEGEILAAQNVTEMTTFCILQIVNRAISATQDGTTS